MKVIVTTDKRGVFYGELTAENDNGQKVKLLGARNIIYWSEDTRGFLGLAITGPAKGSRVGPAVSEIVIYGVTSVAKCSSAAVDRIEAEPWN